MAKKMHDTPMLDQLESGPWPSFVTGLKREAAKKHIMVDLLGQLETSYKTKKGYWKGGTVGVFGYGGGVIPRFTELKDDSSSTSCSLCMALITASPGRLKKPGAPRSGVLPARDSVPDYAGDMFRYCERGGP